MSQFMLCRLQEVRKLNANCRIEAVTGGFLLDVSHVVFGSVESFVLGYKGKTVDELFTDAQASVNSGLRIEDTELFEFMSTINGPLIEAIFWYGNDFSDLDDVKNFNMLLVKLEEAIREASCEAYLHYRRD